MKAGSSFRSFGGWNELASPAAWNATGDVASVHPVLTEMVKWPSMLKSNSYATLKKYGIWPKIAQIDEGDCTNDLKPATPGPMTPHAPIASMCRNRYPKTMAVIGIGYNHTRGFCLKHACSN